MIAIPVSYTHLDVYKRQPYDILLPWGLFYDIGRVFIVVGAVSLCICVVKKLIQRTFAWETFLLIQLIGGGFNCLIVTAVLHQIDALYIPLVLCEAWGVYTLLQACLLYTSPVPGNYRNIQNACRRLHRYPALHFLTAMQ